MRQCVLVESVCGSFEQPAVENDTMLQNGSLAPMNCCEVACALLVSDNRDCPCLMNNQHAMPDADGQQADTDRVLSFLTVHADSASALVGDTQQV
jgi:hypothetical protein